MRHRRAIARRAAWLVAVFVAIVPLGCSQTLTVLHSFAGPDGSGPTSALVAGPGQLYYGTTISGGSAGQGTAFSITPGGTFTLLHSFSGADGSAPFGGMLYASDGNLYGMTTAGGAANQGVIYQINSSGKFTVVFTFRGLDGNNPYGSLIEGTDGNAYGFTSGGGQYGYGTAFRITPQGVYTVLHSFNSTDGAYPYSTPFDLQNGIYGGTTRRGGSSNQGTAFGVTDSGAITTIEYSGPYYQPYSGFIRGTGNTFYGTTFSGGEGYGSVYTINGSLQLDTTSTFTSGTGGFAVAGVICASDGDFYGTGVGSFLTPNETNGSIYRVTAAGTQTLVHAFNGSDGAQPMGALVQGRNSFSNEMFFGTTYSGGKNNLGVVYSLEVAP